MYGPGTYSHKKIAYDYVSIRFFMIYTDLTEENTVGNMEAPLLRCFFFNSKLKAGDITTTGQ